MNNATQDISSVGSGAAQGFAAGGPIGAAAGAVKGLASALLGQHTARLKGATTENKAMPQAVQAVDADMQQLVNSYNNGSIDAGQMITALQGIDAGVYKYLKSQVGKPGTAWDDRPLAGDPQKGHLCNKSCTVGCCVYFGSLGPALSLLQVAVGGSGGRWGADDPRIMIGSTGVQVIVPEIFASKYSTFSRPKYALNVVRRPGATLNPPQYAQVGLGVNIPLGGFSEGTVQGQTSPFSTQSQALLQHASVLSFSGQASASRDAKPLLIGVAAAIAIVVGILVLKQ